jgi:hypothetical protein
MKPTVPWKIQIFRKGISTDDSSLVCNQELIKDTLNLDEVQLLMRPMKAGRQLALEVTAKSIMKKKVDTLVLVDSGCT